MKPIEFKYSGQGLYIVDEHNWGDSYGKYYPAVEVDLLVAAAKDIYGAFCISPAKPNAKFIEEFDKALAPFMEET